MTTPASALPPNFDETVQAVARFRASHYDDATLMQRTVNLLTGRLSRPGFVGVLTLLIALWLALNVAMIWMGRKPIDAPPFYWLQGTVAIAALYMAALILTTQRHADQLAQYREQLTLQLAVLGEQKTAKIIQLLEELRRDTPQVADRVDAQAAAMSTPSDPQAMLDAIKVTSEEIIAPASAAP